MLSLESESVNFLESEYSKGGLAEKFEMEVKVFSTKKIKVKVFYWH